MIFYMVAQEDERHKPFRWHYDELDDNNFHVGGRTLLILIVSFSVLLVCTLVFLYLRRACRGRRWEAERAAAAAAIPVAGLDARVIAGLPVRLHRASAAGEEQCSICLSGLMEEEKVNVLPRCGHTFHVECVDVWLRGHTSCPLCRASLVESSAKTELVAAV